MLNIELIIAAMKYFAFDDPLKCCRKTNIVSSSEQIRIINSGMRINLACKNTQLLFILIILTLVTVSMVLAMVIVDFYNPDYSPADKLIYSVIVARYHYSWVFVRHYQRSTFEIPGGHIEENEAPAEAAKRELIEETGAIKFSLVCVSTYSVTQGDETRFGKLYFADINEMGPVPDNSEIAEIALMDNLPSPVTYPDIQPLLFNKVIDYLKFNLRP